METNLIIILGIAVITGIVFLISFKIQDRKKTYPLEFKPSNPRFTLLNRKKFKPVK